MYPETEGEGACPAGPVYAAIDRALWALAPIIFVIFLLNLPSEWAAHSQTEAKAAIEIAAENSRYCEKWGLPADSSEHAECIRDLVGIRARTEQNLRDRISEDGI